MTAALATRETLAPVTPVRADQHPAAVYLGRLAPGSRRAMEQALRVVAGLLSRGRADVQSFPWAALRYQHAQAARSALAARYSPSAANKILSALRGVLTECFRLGLVSGEDYQRAIAVEGIKGSSPLRGRALKSGEVASRRSSELAIQPRPRARATWPSWPCSMARACGARRSWPSSCATTTQTAAA